MGDDAEYMSRALALADQQLGRVWPNPSVGCLIVREGQVVGQGATGNGGRPHAEQIALGEANGRAAGATAYVTLEPCSHWGQTPPCTQALLAAGIRRCVIAVGDPDPRVSGAGIARLRDAGVELSLGVLEEQARALNAGFFSRIQHGRPLVEKIAPDGSARYFDAVLLSSSHAGRVVDAAICIVLEPDIVLARDLSLRHPDATLWFVTRELNGAELRQLNAAGIDVLEILEESPKIDSFRVLSELGGRGLTRLAVIANDPLTRDFLSP